MAEFLQKSHLTRRDFLKLALSSSATVTLLPVLEACNRTPAITPNPPSQAPAAATSMVSAETPAALTAGLEDLPLETFLDESSKRLFLRDPEGVTTGGLADLLGVRNDKLTDVSDDYIRETQRLQAGLLDLLKKYDQTSFTPDQALNAGIYEWYLDDLVRGFPFMYDDYLVIPFVNSLNWNLQFLFTEAQPLTDAQAARDYIARLLQVNTKFEQVLDGLKRRRDFGVILPGLIIPDLLADLEQYTGSVDSHPYYTTFSTKTGQLSDLNSADRQTLLAEAKKAIEANVIPAYQSLIDYFGDPKLAAPEAVGVWRYSNGEEYYAHILRHYTTTGLTPEAIHQLGREHVERLQGEMREAFGRLGYPAAESLASLMRRLSDESGYVSGQPGVEAYQAAIDQATGMLDQAFDIKLKDKIVVVGGKEGNYFTPPPRDGSRPPVFRALTASAQPKFSIKGIAFHEAVPGHGYQFDVARQLNPPLFREAIQYDAYVEGWALYAERLMWELGAYTDDPAGNLGRLDLELLRALRCVVDTGLHARQWTFPQAIQYMLQASGSRHEGEIRRYIMWPAQATSYFVGFLNILELRQRAKDQLGSQFDLKEFHHILLGSGQVPLAMLEQQVDAYIAAKVSTTPKTGPARG